MNMAQVDRRHASPIGASLSVDALERDPYPHYRRLRAEEPVSWVPAMNMWLVTRYEDVKAVLTGDRRFSVRPEHSLVLQIFGDQMLSQDGPDHDAARSLFQPRFRPAAVRRGADDMIHARAAALLDALGTEPDLRRDFAARLPVQVMLELFGMPLSLETDFRRIYSALEAALSNQRGDAAIRAHGLAAAADLQGLFRTHAVLDAAGSALDDGALLRNMTVVFFGGISTVEALLLNALWVLLDDPALMTGVRADPGRLPRLLHEAMRWSGPVQTASRLALSDVRIGGVDIAAGQAISCVLASANRDAAIFANPDRFDPDRPSLMKHLGFAAGAHFCLGSHLALREVEIAIGSLLARFPHIQPRGVLPEMVGHEFRQPRTLPVRLAA